MAVICTRPPTVRFTQIRNEWARDSRISYKARGLLTYLHSHADGYKLSLSQIIRDTTDGKEAVRSGLAELESAGYLVRVPTRSAGRFAEDDYALADPFNAAGMLLPPAMPETRQSDAGDWRETRQSGLSAAVHPQRETRPIEEQGENTKNNNTTPAPSRGRGSEEERQLSLVADEDPSATTVAQRANALATEHFEAVGKVVAFMGIRSIVKAAIDAGHGDVQIRAALAHLRRTNRALTKNALGLLLGPDGSSAVSRSTYGAPHEDLTHDPANPHKFAERF